MVFFQKIRYFFRKYGFFYKIQSFFRKYDPFKNQFLGNMVFFVKYGLQKSFYLLTQPFCQMHVVQKKFSQKLLQKSFNIYETEKDSIRSKNRTRDLSDKNFRVLPSGLPRKVIITRSDLLEKKFYRNFFELFFASVTKIGSNLHIGQIGQIKQSFECKLFFLQKTGDN